MKLVASPKFQHWAARFPLTRRAARRDADRLFDLVSGFAYSQTLYAVIKLGLLDALADGPKSSDHLAHVAGLSRDRMVLLGNAAVALGLLTREPKADGYSLSRLGAAALGVPGLRDMILHHDMFYRDLADPVAFLKGATSPELAEFWPYIRGETAKDIPVDVAARYSRLMAESQRMVAEETLSQVDFGQFRHLMDVGGGTGAFLRSVRDRHPNLKLTLFDLPPVIAAAQDDNDTRSIHRVAGSFLDALPDDCDAISLVRVLYDHSDPTVARLLKNVHSALPLDGAVVISEPMTGGDRPNKSGDVYFSLYTLAMTTGKTRSAQEIAILLENAGFSRVTVHPAARPFVTSVVTARKQ